MLFPHCCARALGILAQDSRRDWFHPWDSPVQVRNRLFFTRTHVCCRDMQFESEIVAAKTLQEVVRFFAEPTNLARWDKSVAQVIPTSAEPGIVGFTFDTIAPSGMRMSYRIIAHEPDRSTHIELTSSPIFRRAVWHMQLDPVPLGTRITCRIDFRLRPHFLFLIVPLLLTQRRALRADLRSLKAVLESAGW